MPYHYEYDPDKMTLDRWNTKTEKYGTVRGKFGNALAARRKAQEDFNRLKNLTRSETYALFNDGTAAPMTYLE